MASKWYKSTNNTVYHYPGDRWIATGLAICGGDIGTVSHSVYVRNEDLEIYNVYPLCKKCKQLVLYMAKESTS